MIAYAYAVAVVAAIAVVDAVWASMAGIAVAGVTAKVLLPSIPGVLAALMYAVPRDAFRRCAHLVAATAVLIAFSNAASILSYLVLTLRMPLADPMLLAIDRAMSFDWIVWSDAVRARPWLGAVLSAVYSATFPSIVVALVWLSGSGRTERCAELTWTIMASGIVVVAISALLPALSAPIWLAAPERAHMAGVFYPDYVQDLLAMHKGILREIRDASGVISFPSYHAVLTLLVAYALRRTLLFWPAAILAALTLLSIPSVGMHYLIDIPGGALVALVTIVILRRATIPASIPSRQSSIPVAAS